jgi:hypothetical protein
MLNMFEIVDAGFAGAEQRGDATIIWCHPTPDGREAVVEHERLRIGPAGAAEPGAWFCYATPMSAILSAARWIEAGCRHEPYGWTRDLRTGRIRREGVAKRHELVWVCPRHRDRLPTFARGRLFCATCKRSLDDAVQVPWPPQDAVAALDERH